jgi:MinD superfamily P-loop ATPase
VEEPNGHIFLKPKIDKSTPAKVLVPVIDRDKCTSCGECSAHCQFNALVTLPNNVLLFPELCHGCGLCIHICPERAIRDGDREIGLIEKGTATEDIDFIHGILNVGEPMAGPLIQEVKHHYKEHYVRIIDAPPGTSCPVVKTISDADVVVMVTEPTPFGLHDLKIAVSVAKNLGKPIGIVINRQNGEFPPLEAYLSKNDLPVIMVLPEDREIARHYSMGDIILKTLPVYVDRFMELVANIGRLSGIRKETKQVKQW